MKKLIILGLLFILISFIPKKDTVVPVFNNMPFKLEDYNVFYLELKEEDINTSNILKLIPSSVDIISITPYINPIYENKLKLKYNFISNISSKKNIENFIKYYKDTIKSLNYIDDLNNIDINGIKINEAVVFARGSDIIKIMNSKNIKYKKVFYEEYEYLEV